jgi:hypothetical protein
MKPLDFNAKHAFPRYHTYFCDTSDYHINFPSTTPEDFYKDAQNWLTLGLISLNHNSLAFNHDLESNFGNTFKCLDGGHLFVLSYQFDNVPFYQNRNVPFLV